MGAQHLYSEIAPPRRGAVLALEVDSTCRAYDLVALAFGGVTPEESQKHSSKVVLWLQAETNDVYFYFASGAVGAVATGDVDDIDNTAKVAAGSALTFASTYAAVLEAGNFPLRITIDRSVDRFLVVKAASTAGVLRLWAGSQGY